MGRLPFGDCGNQRGGPCEALVIGYAANEASGEDRSLLAVERRPGADHAALLRALVAVEPRARALAVADSGLSLLELGSLWNEPAPVIDAAWPACVQDAHHRRLRHPSNPAASPIRRLNRDRHPDEE
jgi:hypothetical protein